MKEASSCGWITKFGGALLVLLLALPSYAQLMLAHEGHHDAGGCTIKTGEFPVTFSAYEVPEGNIPPMHSYCENIPNTGKVNLTIELTDHASRQIPLAVRLVKEDHAGHSDKAHSAAVVEKEESEDIDYAGREGMDHDGHDMAGHENHGDTKQHAEEHGIVYMPPETHNSGIIVVAANIEEKGRYAVLLEKQDEAGNVSTAVRIPLRVGGGGGHAGHGGGFGMMEIALLLVVAGGGAFYLIRRKRSSETADESSKS